MKKILGFLILLTILAAAGFLAYRQSRLETVSQISTFEECAAAGYPVLESYPERCLTPDGRTLSNTKAVIQSAPSVDGNYDVDTNRSVLVWEGKRKYIPSYVDRGTIKLSAGRFTVTQGRLESGEIEIDMKSIAVDSTGRGDGQPVLATQLKSKDFFDTERYPTAMFKLTSVDNLPDGVFALSGDLTIRGITKPITFQAEANQLAGEVAISGEVIIDRSQFDVKFGSESFFKNLGDNAIEDNFKVIISLVASPGEGR